MADLRELYQQVILDHNKNPRNFKELETAERKAEGYNPLCGDHYTIYVDLDGDTIRDIAFHGAGCAISKASASVMTSAVKGKSVAEAEKLFHEFHDILMGEAAAEPDIDKLGRLAAFVGVRDFPSRIKCATLAWHAMNNAIHGDVAAAKTE